MTRWIGQSASWASACAQPWPRPWPAAAGNADSSTAVVVPEPNSVTTKARRWSGTAGAATPRRLPPRLSTTSTTPVKAEGWGTLKGQVIFGGDPPPPQVLQEQGKAAKDPDVCAKDGPIVSERLVVDRREGRQERARLPAQADAVNDDAKKAAAAAKVVFDQKNCVFEPHVLAVMAGTPLTLKSSDPANHNINVKLKNSTFNQIVTPAEPVRSLRPSRSVRPGRSFAIFIPG